MIHIRELLDKERNYKTQCAVYKMKTDSWKVLEQEDFQIPKAYNNSNNVCVNGVYYWKTNYNVLAFYFGTEVFQLLEPPCTRIRGTLIKLHDCISLWDTEMVEGDGGNNEVWLLNENGHWTKLLKIEYTLEVGEMLGFWKKNIIFVLSVCGQLLLYNLVTKEFSETGIKNVGYGDMFSLFIYEESLVPTKRN